MAKELNFTDPVFRSKVILTGPANILYEVARPQFERLKGIKSLGLTAHTNEITMHTRHDHLVGLMRIYNKLCQQPNTKGLPKSFLWSFWCRLCFAQTGHAAFSYDSEKAVLLACHLSPTLKKRLGTLVQPVIDILSPCQICEKGCSAKNNGSAEGSNLFDALIKNNAWKRIYLWIAALKLIANPEILPILENQEINEKNKLGFAKPEALKMLIETKCFWNESFRRLSQLDYIVRDLAFAGTLGIQLDVDSLLSVVDKPHRDWKLLANLNTYMSDTLYESLEAQTGSVFFQRVLAKLLIENRVSLDELFGLGINNSYDDAKLEAEIKSIAAGREVFNQNARKSWNTWSINTFIDNKQLPCELEKKITGQDKGHLHSHANLRTTSFKLRQDHHLAISMFHQSLGNRPKAKSFVKLCRSILKIQHPTLVPEQLTTALIEGLVACKFEHGLASASNRLSKLSLNLDKMRPVADFVNKRASGGARGGSDFSLKIGGFEYPFNGGKDAIQNNVMHAAISGDDTVRKNLGVTLNGASFLLWQELLRWQSIYFGLNPKKRLLTLIDEAQNKLAQQVISDSVASASNLELYTLLEALKEPNDSVSFRVTLPNLKLFNEDGKPENEYDVVSVVLLRDKDVEVWVWGVTIEKKFIPKKNLDSAKIQKLADLLGGRWGADVRVVRCYIHKDGNDICLEKDGVQGRRNVQQPAAQ